jgi:hypothetical protein
VEGLFLTLQLLLLRQHSLPRLLLVLVLVLSLPWQCQ